MLARALSIWANVRSSLWALPLAIATGATLLAVLALTLKLPWTSEIGWLWAGGERQALEFAGNLVSAMITLVALAFSITMVVLTLAAQQLGPRLILIFMQDRGTQAALGLFLGTVFYLLLVLRAVAGGGEDSPSLAITIGTGLVFASMLVLLLFVHSLARSIIADSVISRAGDALDHAIDAAFPEEADTEPAPAPPRDGHAVRLRDRGYVLRIDYGGLAKEAARHDCRIVLAHGPGAHVVNGDVDAWIDGPTGAEGLAPLKRALARGIVIAPRRLDAQNPEWATRHLVEIALRALSPGINDEFTALAAIDRLTRALARLMERREAPGVWRDSEGVARVFGPVPTFSVMLDAAFQQIVESGAEKSSVRARLAEAYLKLAALAQAGHVEPLKRHLAALARADARSAEHDVEMGRRLDDALALLAGRASPKLARTP